MASRENHIDALVLGDHPSAYLAAALLCHKTKLSVIHDPLPVAASHDRLVLVNPAFFGLHLLLEAGLKTGRLKMAHPRDKPLLSEHLHFHSMWVARRAVRDCSENSLLRRLVNGG